MPYTIEYSSKNSFRFLFRCVCKINNQMSMQDITYKFVSMSFLEILIWCVGVEREFRICSIYELNTIACDSYIEDRENGRLSDNRSLLYTCE